MRWFDSNESNRTTDNRIKFVLPTDQTLIEFKLFRLACSFSASADVKQMYKYTIDSLQSTQTQKQNDFDCKVMEMKWDQVKWNWTNDDDDASRLAQSKKCISFPFWLMWNSFKWCHILIHIQIIFISKWFASKLIVLSSKKFILSAFDLWIADDAASRSKNKKMQSEILFRCEHAHTFAPAMANEEEKINSV